jgi:uncharacterized protein YjbI with pentapeptide repeats
MENLSTGWWLIPFTVVSLAVIAAFVLWRLPQWQVEQMRGLNRKERFDRENEARKTLATILGGMVLLAGFFGTWQNLKVAQEGQITDRFTKAIEQLGKPELDVRLGGIYALERIANDSERDHWPIMEVLCTYVREHAKSVQEQASSNQWEPSDVRGPAIEPYLESQLEHPTADIQAILTVLGRRNRTYEKPKQQLQLFRADLRGADLRGADLSGANLRGANLQSANFVGANLGGADLNTADLRWANLRWANLNHANLNDANLRVADLADASLIKATIGGADLRSAILVGANLSWANLQSANFLGANLKSADLSGANLSGADLNGVNHAEQQQINTAAGNSVTKLPANLHMPEAWKKPAQ